VLAAGGPCRIIFQFSGRRLELALERTKARNLALFREFPRANLGNFPKQRFLFLFVRSFCFLLETILFLEHQKNKFGSSNGIKLNLF